MSQRLKQYIMGSRCSVNNDKYQKEKGEWSESACHYHAYVKSLNSTGKYLGLSSKPSPFSFVLRSFHLFVVANRQMNRLSYYLMHA
ncbi:hypothetical protein [Priestia sp. JNUCC 25]